jgi:hypothetical protein
MATAAMSRQKSHRVFSNGSSNKESKLSLPVLYDSITRALSSKASKGPPSTLTKDNLTQLVETKQEKEPKPLLDANATKASLWRLFVEQVKPKGLKIWINFKWLFNVLDKDSFQQLVRVQLKSIFTPTDLPKGVRNESVLSSQADENSKQVFLRKLNNIDNFLKSGKWLSSIEQPLAIWTKTWPTTTENKDEWMYKLQYVFINNLNNDYKANRKTFPCEAVFRTLAAPLLPKREGVQTTAMRQVMHSLDGTITTNSWASFLMFSCGKTQEELNSCQNSMILAVCLGLLEDVLILNIFNNKEIYIKNVGNVEQYFDKTTAKTQYDTIKPSLPAGACTLMMSMNLQILRSFGYVAYF